MGARMAVHETPDPRTGAFRGCPEKEMSVGITGSGKVVVNRSMSLDGFIAGPGHRMDWGGGRPLADFVAPGDVAEIAAATGAMLIGRRTWEVGSKMEAEDP